ncbi:MAG TPA: NUDIX domain-containing protein, partial [Beutenbergiaceae bacterium]|nr:NUDIX domain-containing protein [Beutenbergiaceae bacterium]
MHDTSDAQLAVDLVLTATNNYGRKCILLVRRPMDSEAYPGYLALPGAYVNRGERVHLVADRIAFETTGTNLWYYKPRLVDVFDHPERDPRGNVCSIVFAGTLDRMLEPVAGGDVDAAGWVPLSTFENTRLNLAFDHDDIV